MYRLNIEDFDQFLTDFWQKRPCVVRNAFELFDDPLDQHELAGLAQEPEVDSRIIQQHNQNWRVEHGPFADFHDICKHKWTLLVQGVDRYSLATHSLLKAFSLVPRWRIEDVMVSFSVEGAGVGPHLDQYDVFIVQGKGSRRWQVGEKRQYNEFKPHPDLRQIENFEAIIDDVLYPGDLIYIPPGFPHNGVALEECLNYSIGLRAPSQQELLIGFADWCAENDAFDKLRYQDPELQSRTCQFEMQAQELAHFRSLLLATVDSNLFDDFLGSYLTGGLDDDGYIDEFQEKFTKNNIKKLIETNTILVRQPDAKLLLLPPRENLQNTTKQDWKLFVNHSSISIPNKLIDTVKALISPAQCQIPRKIYYENSLFFVQLVSTLLNTGSYDAADESD